jgi:hypothetical protein
MKDSGDAIFGAWLGGGLRVSKGSYYGSGKVGCIQVDWQEQLCRAM